MRSGRLLAISPTYRRRSIHELNKRLPANALPIDEKIDIVLEYPRAFLKANGEQVGAFDLELGGISGSPVWAISADPSLSARRRLRLVGIVSGCSPGEYLRVKR